MGCTALFRSLPPSSTGRKRKSKRRDTRQAALDQFLGQEDLSVVAVNRGSMSTEQSRGVRVEGIISGDCTPNHVTVSSIPPVDPKSREFLVDSYCGTY